MNHQGSDDLEPDGAPCSDGLCCLSTCAAAPCDDDQRCWNGQCDCGDFCASGCQFTSIQKAVVERYGRTVHVCAGTYRESVGLIGDGDGPDVTVIDAANLTNGNGTSIFVLDNANVTLQGLRMTDALCAGLIGDLRARSR